MTNIVANTVRHRPTKFERVAVEPQPKITGAARHVATSRDSEPFSRHVPRRLFPSVLPTTLEFGMDSLDNHWVYRKNSHGHAGQPMTRCQSME
jgi:hypothetical protein